jgi:hypothetical protein
MGRKAGLIAVAGAIALAGIASSDWLAKSEAGLRQLITGSVVTAPVNGATVTISAAWQEPGKGAAEAVAMSEQDWLRIADDMAPVSYYAETPVETVTATPAEQQPL